MSLENALRELGKEIQKDARFKALQDAAAKNDADADGCVKLTGHVCFAVFSEGVVDG